MDYADQSHHPDGAYLELHRTIRQNIAAICTLNARLEATIINGESCAHLTKEAKDNALQTQALLRRYTNLVNHSTSAVERSERRLGQQELQAAFHSSLKQLEDTAHHAIPITNRAPQGINEDRLISVAIRDDDIKREINDDRARHLLTVKSEIDDIKDLYQEMNHQVTIQGRELNMMESQIIQTSDYSHLANQQLALARKQVQIRTRRMLSLVGVTIGVLAGMFYLMTA
eukprot:GHVH01002837.1.p1 GENE.GHVH01002837.1~~GHVH01002837.1.p1  ORF type:complete len:241 (-),score=30.21 GHVH01002837.1:908-1594(-)